MSSCLGWGCTLCSHFIFSPGTERMHIFLIMCLRRDFRPNAQYERRIVVLAIQDDGGKQSQPRQLSLIHHSEGGIQIFIHSKQHLENVFKAVHDSFRPETDTNRESCRQTGAIHPHCDLSSLWFHVSLQKDQSSAGAKCEFIFVWTKIRPTGLLCVSVCSWSLLWPFCCTPLFLNDVNMSPVRDVVIRANESRKERGHRRESFCTHTHQANDCDWSPAWAIRQTAAFSRWDKVIFVLFNTFPNALQGQQIVTQTSLSLSFVSAKPTCDLQRPWSRFALFLCITWMFSPSAEHVTNRFHSHPVIVD